MSEQEVDNVCLSHWDFRDCAAVCSSVPHHRLDCYVSPVLSFSYRMPQEARSCRPSMVNYVQFCGWQKQRVVSLHRQNLAGGVGILPVERGI
jgi:hypothetical protein